MEGACICSGHLNFYLWHPNLAPTSIHNGIVWQCAFLPPHINFMPLFLGMMDCSTSERNEL